MTVLDGVDLTAPGRTTPDRTTSQRTTERTRDRAAADRAAADRAAADRAAADRAAADRAAAGRAAGDRARSELAAAERAALARAVLARAELRTGARSTLRSTGRGGLGAPTDGAPAHAAAPAEAPARSTGTAAGPAVVGLVGPAAGAPVGPATGAAAAGPAAGLAAGPVAVPAAVPSPAPGRQGSAPAAGSSLTRPDRPPLPVLPALAGLLPEGALRRGASMVVTGSTSLLLSLVARASQEGSWVAVVGLPAVGLLAAQQAGVVLDRLALVPRPGPDAPTVLAALLDGVDVVVVGDDAALVDPDRRRLTARARERGTVLLSTTSWPGAHVVLTAEPVEWTGLGAGHGHLDRHRLAVTRVGRGSAGRGSRAEVVLPVRADRTDPVPARSAGPANQDDALPAAPLRMVG